VDVPGLPSFLLPRSTRPRNDVEQYDDFVEAWSDPDGPFAMLFWLAEARAGLIPPAPRQGAVLVDVACGGGLLVEHARRLGYRHVGVDLSGSGLRVTRDRGGSAVQGDVTRLPIRSAVADVVAAGEIFEHVEDTDAVIAEVCRVLRPGGTVVLDTIADTLYGRLSSITVAERIPGGPPPGIHDPALFVDRAALVQAFSRHGVSLRLTGLRLPPVAYLRWAWARARHRRRGCTSPAAAGAARSSAATASPLPVVRLQSTTSTAGLFQGTGRKEDSA
jgi:2-polyprenyl-6-hydroxyphenyl methylase/3-demethylubiquinone-9 3-methyltransferase